MKRGKTNANRKPFAVVVKPVVGRIELASRILAGLCANPSVIAHNHNCGWSLVNCTDADLAGYAVSLADALVSAEANAPNPADEHRPTGQGGTNEASK